MAQPWQKRLKHILNQHVKPFVFVALIMCSFRSSIADWNDVPTGSMNPSIIEGDRIFVNKLAYDLKVPFTTWRLVEWDHPERGEVVVFYAPTDGTRMVKRVVGLPGDTISLVDNRLYVNGQPMQYQAADPAFAAAMAGRVRGSAFESETIGGHAHPVMTIPNRFGIKRDFGPIVVPAGKYFMMGDSRDNSSDSREWGFVPRDQIVGRSSAIAISLDPERHYMPRWARFFKSLP